MDGWIIVFDTDSSSYFVLDVRKCLKRGTRLFVGEFETVTNSSELFFFIAGIGDCWWQTAGGSVLWMVICRYPLGSTVYPIFSDGFLRITSSSKIPLFS